jgi:hypothetical protein
MKKIFITLLLFFLFFSQTLSYNPSSNDKKILNKIYTKLDPICEKSPKSCEIFI